MEEIRHAKPKILVTLSDKEVYQRFRKVFKLETPLYFARDAVGKAFPIKIAGISTTLFPMIHPDISRSKGDGDNRKKIAREKWSGIHMEKHIPALQQLLNGL